MGLLKTSRPGETRASGVSSYLRHVAAGLAELGVDAAFFWTEGAGAGARERPYSRPRAGWAEYRALRLGNPKLSSALGSWFRDEKPDVLHVHWSFADSLALLRDLPDDAPPAVVSLHTYEAVCPLKTHVTRSGRPCTAVPGAVCLREGCRSLPKWLVHDVPARRLRRDVASRAAVWLAHNRELTEIARRVGLPSVRHLPLAVPRPAAPPPPHPRRPTLLYAGRLRPEKGIHVLAAALPGMLASHPDAELRVAGEGPLEGALRRAVPPPDAQRVILLGSLEPAALAQEYARARALLVPSVWKENFALVGLEAMAWGTPVIGSNLGGIRDWLRDGENGLRVPPGDDGALAEAVASLVRSPGLAAKLGEGAARTARELSLDRHVRELVTLYREIAGR